MPQIGRSRFSVKTCPNFVNVLDIKRLLLLEESSTENGESGVLKKGSSNNGAQCSSCRDISESARCIGSKRVVAKRKKRKKNRERKKDGRKGQRLFFSEGKMRSREMSCLGCVCVHRCKAREGGKLNSEHEYARLPFNLSSIETLKGKRAFFIYT